MPDNEFKKRYTKNPEIKNMVRFLPEGKAKSMVTGVARLGFLGEDAIKGKVKPEYLSVA
jgi:hypothetical protein